MTSIGFFLAEEKDAVLESCQGLRDSMDPNKNKQYALTNGGTRTKYNKLGVCMRWKTNDLDFTSFVKYMVKPISDEHAYLSFYI